MLAHNAVTIHFLKRWFKNSYRVWYLRYIRSNTRFDDPELNNIYYRTELRGAKIIMPAARKARTAPMKSHLSGICFSTTQSQTNEVDI